jgi:hypothetical protein
MGADLHIKNLTQLSNRGYDSSDSLMIRTHPYTRIQAASQLVPCPPLATVSIEQRHYSSPAPSSK